MMKRAWSTSWWLCLCICAAGLAGCGDDESGGDGDGGDLSSLDVDADAQEVVETGACDENSDCASMLCDVALGECLPSSCSDLVQNGDETGVDCGGMCRLCSAGEGCEADADCTTQICDVDFGLCAPRSESCTDGELNNLESDVDCGGARCTPCDAGGGCDQDEDCASDFCDVNGFFCGALPTCDDGAANGAEADIDCGGPDCAPCDVGRLCQRGEDCATGVCQGALCAPAAACDDGILNSGETDVDCGGPDCAPCLVGRQCVVDGDCASLICDGAACACEPGFADDGAGSCADTDECDASPCDPNAICTNTPGSFTCQCDTPTYVGDGLTCTLSTDCQTNPAVCSDDAQCLNTVCQCDPGYSGDGLSCVDIDECASGAAGCDPLAGCTNAPGGFTCGACPTGYDDVDGDGTRCADIDECARGTAGCHAQATCANDQGGFTCTCRVGYDDVTGDGTSCIPFASCQDMLEGSPTPPPSGIYSIDPDGSGGQPGIRTYCLMDPALDGGGWTLAMKVDGRLKTFEYHATYWTTSAVYDEAQVSLNRVENKNPAFNRVPFTEVLVQFESPIDTSGPLDVNSLIIPKAASSLLDVFSGTTPQTTNLGHLTWKSLIDGSALQDGCYLEGFNALKVDAPLSTMARIGIIGDLSVNCLLTGVETPNSVLGVGTSGEGCGLSDLSAGNMVGCNTDNNNFNQPAFVLIFVR